MSRATTALLSALTALLAACSSGHGGATCRRAEAPATGPGDATGLFPAAPGDLWAYRVTDETGTWRTRVKVAGPATAGGRAGVRFLDEPLGTTAHPRAEALLSVGPGGVTVLESGEWDDFSPGLRALIGPRLLLRFPVTAGDVFVALDCTSLDAGSLDGDAAADPVDLRSEVEVVFHGLAPTPLGDREAFLCREATKLHEEYVRAPLSTLRASLAAREVVKGEIVLVVAGAPAAAPLADQDPVALYRALAAEGRTRREAVKEAARRLGRHAREVYQLVQEAGPGGE